MKGQHPRGLEVNEAPVRHVLGVRGVPHGVLGDLAQADRRGELPLRDHGVDEDEQALRGAFGDLLGLACLLRLGGGWVLRRRCGAFGGVDDRGLLGLLCRGLDDGLW